jgi:anthranilate phosphoribosyltransferase
LDELTTTTTSRIWEVSPNLATTWELDPTKLGIKRATVEQLIGGDAAQNAQIARDLFEGKTSGNLGAVRDIVILNAAGGVVAYQSANNGELIGSELTNRFESALELVTIALEAGKARQKLEQWVTATR